MLNHRFIAILAVAAVSACSSPMHTTGNYRNQGYLQDGAGRQAVVKSQGYDVCVRTSDWTPGRAIIQCDPDLVPKPVVKAPPAPKPKVEAPPPKPAPAPAKPVMQSFTLSADALFDFDQVTIKPAGREKLDELVNSLRGTRYQNMTVTGHTDRAGSVSYNQRLSERRAQSVKHYLESKGIEADKITAIGKGKSETKINPPACRQRGMTREQIYACLQPDRRVVIEVSGTRQGGAKPASSR